MDEIIYEPNDMKKMNKTSIGFRPIKKTYEEKLDNFMAQNNLKYIEPISNTKNKIPTPNSDKGKDKINYIRNLFPINVNPKNMLQMF